MGIVGDLLSGFLPSNDAYLFMWILSALGITALGITIERWLTIGRLTDYDAPLLFSLLKQRIDAKKTDEALAICKAAGSRALPVILAAGIRKFQEEPLLVSQAMSEESTSAAARIERRLSFLVMFGNVSTLLGLLGTVYGLIMAFTAVGQPGVAAVEKSSLLAEGISTAMNSTLVGLSISIPCVMIYSFLRARADAALIEIDRFGVALLRLLDPPASGRRLPVSLTRRSRETEEPADTDVTPMLNLMVMLIPFLLTSSEFIKIGAIELKLPEAKQTGAGIGGTPAVQETRLDIGIIITAQGFSLFHYFKQETPASNQDSAAQSIQPDIPLVDGLYDFETLNRRLVEIKRRTLIEIIKTYIAPPPENATLAQLANAYFKHNLESTKIFPDHESIKIVAQDQVNYQTVISVMDAARATRAAEGIVTLFPNVAIAGGIVQ
jgi:biopolymer transport protein ExbB